VLGVRLVVADGQARGGGTVPCPACAMPRLIAQAGIGAEYLTDGKPGVIRHFDPATLADTTPLRMVQQFGRTMTAALDQGAGLYLWGQHGAGKSLLAAHCVAGALAQHRSARFITALDLLDGIKARFGRRDAENASAEAWLERYATPDLLVLDDLGAHSTSAWVLEKLLGLINGRLSRRRSLIVTANVHPQQLAADFAQVDPAQAARIASRLASAAYPVEVQARGDYRRVQAARLRSYFVAPDYTPPALGQAHPHYQHSEG
jgi:DNA replication protein DnaC